MSKRLQSLQETSQVQQAKFLALFHNHPGETSSKRDQSQARVRQLQFVGNFQPVKSCFKRSHLSPHLVGLWLCLNQYQPETDTQHLQFLLEPADCPVNEESRETPEGGMVLPNHLSDLYNRSKGNLNIDQREELKKLLLEYQDVFSKDKNDLGRTGLIKHKIDVGTNAPIKQPPRIPPLAKREQASKEIKNMAEQGVIEPSNSPWVSPVVLVRKKDGSTRFCVDYRKLNAITKKDSYPLPRVETSLHAFFGSSWFSTLDLKSGHWQVEMDESDKEKTAFSIGEWLWQFLVMPFGLCNVPATFERLIEHVLMGLPWNVGLVYLDDIIVHAKSFDDELSRLSEVFNRMKEAKLKLNPKKCLLFQDEVNYLGHKISKDRIATDPTKVEAVKNWLVPRNNSELRSFLRLCSYYRRFVKSFTELTHALNQLLTKGTPFVWTNECQVSRDNTVGCEQLIRH